MIKITGYARLPLPAALVKGRRMLGYPHFYQQPTVKEEAVKTIAFSMRYLAVCGGPAMTIAEPLASVDSLESEIARNIPKFPHTGAAFGRTESGDGGPFAENLGNRLRQVSRLAIGEIDSLISELQTLRRKLQTDGERIERDIARYAELNQQVMQLTTIISDSVKKLPQASGITR